MKNLKTLNQDELKNINGGKIIEDIIYPIPFPRPIFPMPFPFPRPLPFPFPFPIISK
ncbi:bacteriocin [Aquimarina sp. D1M17]|uniref:bacteriocin-like protein n=1 Tax=Aquimarina acroporae TaxID=2937283 RepID=UPI0020C15C0A|nr:bacteriocin [Aquimarina acroporae]MCK8523068.1 bacteriocin [Aquimarina acroporae]